MRHTHLLYLKVITTVTILSLVTLTCVTIQDRVTGIMTSQDPVQTNVERYWVEAKTWEGFMEVEQVLGDPKTTIDPDLQGYGYAMGNEE